ncbi:LL-diaminopimelate aminotransferase [Coprobacter tertius]|uniref:LL-diaminopimelate aminotransferase n=1 Tax=Coprobacter tertius TaxID=2944915 RepID=A0ABT1MIE4_9BACT|nr:LL-diaminopimelate aminotransferase [Coprobacter tertius]MCP9611829.1 LL-diaminopimelate aminotransferase [Coprobacter tertius]
MALINEQFLKLSESYLFSEIAKKVNTFKVIHPEAKVIRLGIGDVTQPLPSAVIKALHKAVDEMGNIETFRGYGPEQGYRFLIDAIIKNDYESCGISLDPDEVFVNDGAKSDTGNIGDILSKDNRVAVTDPVYPVYIDSNVMGCRAGELQNNGFWSNIIYIPCHAGNNFIPEFPEVRPDVIYLCYPNNPTGTALNRKELKKWVNYAINNNILILFDSAYEAFIQEEDVPHSIYEIKGAKQVAIEFRSFSKTAGFTGLRCGYTVIPKELKAFNFAGDKVGLNQLWNRRQCTKFNGTAYIVQRAAEAIYTPEGKAEVKANISYYMRNARLLYDNLKAIGLEVFGGVNAPYIWVKTPKGISSWKFFDRLLFERHIVGTPGVGFGPSGEGYLRLTAFGKYEDTLEAIDRLKTWKI